MSRYADRLLADGESVVYRTRQHWLATLIDARYPWLIFLASIALLVLSSNVGDNAARTVIGYVVLAGIIVSLLWLAKIYWNWYSEDYIVTNRRVLKVDGIINKRSADSSLEKINDAVLEQNLLGRLLNYGDLDILTAAEVAIDRFRMLRHAPEFKRQMLNQKHELEGEFSRPLPAPPLRSSPPQQPAPPPLQPRQMTPDEVTRALSSLADLRDRGAISPEEFEAKKADLLGRL